MKRKLLIFSNGYRSVSEGNASFSPSIEEFPIEVNLTDVTDEEFKKIKSNPHNDKYINNVKDRTERNKK